MQCNTNCNLVAKRSIIITLILAVLLFLYTEEFEWLPKALYSPPAEDTSQRIPPYPPANWSYFGQEKINCNFTITYEECYGGFSPRFRCLLGSLWSAKILSRTLIIDYTHSSYFPEWSHYFAEIPSAHVCPQKIPKGAKNVQVDKPVDPQTPHLYESIGHCGGEFPQVPVPEGFLHLAAQLLWRFNPHGRAQIEEVLSSFPKWAITEFTAIHVRRGDKNFGPSKEANFVSTEIYLNEVEKATNPEITPIFIAADSLASVSEFVRLRPRWKIWYIDRDEFNKMRLGNFSVAEFEKQPPEYRYTFTKYFFSEMVMMQFAAKLFCTRTSNVCHLQAIIRGEKKTIHIPENPY